jgi:hypothetical protein
MHVRLTTKLPISADAAIALVRPPALLNHIAAPLLRFTPVAPAEFPPVWQEGTYRVRVLLARLLPLGRQWIDLSYDDASAGSFRVRDNGRGDLARRWDHWITIAPDGEHTCIYVDEIEIEAGLLTPFVWAFARLFYAHRQRRWRALAAKGGAGARRLALETSWRERLSAELSDFSSARADHDVPRQWRALERAHILSQVALAPHLNVHWMMLKLAVRLGDLREVAGQALRLALAPLGSLTGRIPWGNTGRARIDAFTPMPIPTDLRDVLPT